MQSTLTKFVPEHTILVPRGGIGSYKKTEFFSRSPRYGDVWLSADSIFDLYGVSRRWA